MSSILEFFAVPISITSTIPFIIGSKCCDSIKVVFFFLKSLFIESFSIFLTKCGVIYQPRFAMVAAKFASCIGVVNISPWPIELEIVVTALHELLYQRL